ncbi:MAG: hypothetical protein ACLSAH_09715 [Bilophila wadsworthia]
MLDELNRMAEGIYGPPAKKLHGVELSTAQYSRLNELHGTTTIGGKTLHESLGNCSPASNTTSTGTPLEIRPTRNAAPAPSPSTASSMHTDRKRKTNCSARTIASAMKCGNPTTNASPPNAGP